MKTKRSFIDEHFEQNIAILLRRRDENCNTLYSLAREIHGNDYDALIESNYQILIMVDMFRKAIISKKVRDD